MFTGLLVIHQTLSRIFFSSYQKEEKTEETEKYYIISNEIIKSEVKSYNSFDSLIDQNAVYKFLEHNNILT